MEQLGLDFIPFFRLLERRLVVKSPLALLVVLLVPGKDAIKGCFNVDVGVCVNSSVLDDLVVSFDQAVGFGGPGLG